MKNIYIAVFLLLPVVIPSGLYAEQDGGGDSGKSSYNSGGIIIRGRPLSSIEKMTTSSTIDSSDVEEHSDKTLDDSLKNAVAALRIDGHGGLIQEKKLGLMRHTAGDVETALQTSR